MVAMRYRDFTVTITSKVPEIARAAVALAEKAALSQEV
jgi:hypothetical protein